MPMKGEMVEWSIGRTAWQHWYAGRTWEDICLLTGVRSVRLARRYACQFARRHGYAVPPKVRDGERTLRAYHLHRDGMPWQAVAAACGFPSAEAARYAVARYRRRHGLPGFAKGA